MEADAWHGVAHPYHLSRHPALHLLCDKLSVLCLQNQTPTSAWKVGVSETLLRNFLFLTGGQNDAQLMTHF